MSMLRRSLAGLDRPLTRCFKSDAVRRTRPTWVRPKENPTGDFEQGSSTGRCSSGPTFGNGNDKDEDRDSAFERSTVPVEHLKHRRRMQELFPAGWNPPRKLSREAMGGLRALHAHDPATFSTQALAERFRVSPEAVRRILRSKWLPSKEEKAKLLERERKRKQENIAKGIERERVDKWAVVDRQENTREKRHREEDDGFTLV